MLSSLPTDSLQLVNPLCFVLTLVELWLIYNVPTAIETKMALLVSELLSALNSTSLRNVPPFWSLFVYLYTAHDKKIYSTKIQAFKTST